MNRDWRMKASPGPGTRYRRGDYSNGISVVMVGVWPGFAPMTPKPPGVQPTTWVRNASVNNWRIQQPNVAN